MSTLRDWRRLSMVTLLSAAVLAGCEQKPQQDQSAATAPRQVESVAVKTESLTVINELPGRVEPVRVAQVRARVAGIVLTRNFEEGADVKAGAVLFQIDPAPFKAALSKAQGDLARTEATLFEARATVKRYESLVEIEAVSRQTYDTARATMQNAVAAKRSAQADVETAQLNLGFATVRA
ncbi:efflux RND transporter periplasmic adaptor subunit, partial [Pseudomonas viridiflava]|uniref:efflux RND transporter periplasmic adaptor subunit n=2 Tax=Pseudomonas TaxID=286 RepID=UPI000F02AC1A